MRAPEHADRLRGVQPGLLGDLEDDVGGLEAGRRELAHQGVDVQVVQRVRVDVEEQQPAPVAATHGLYVRAGPG